MSRLMYDSINPQSIPTDAQMVAGYVDGRFAWPQSGWDRFPSSTKVRIAVFASTGDGDVLDVENGNATPQEAPGWISGRLQAGVPRPTIYCNRNTRPAVESACASAGLNPDFWIATLDGTQDIPGTVAVQYAGSSSSGGDYDLSIVTDDTWPGGNMADLQDITNRLGALEYMLVPDGGGTTVGELALRIRSIDDHLNQLAQTVSVLKQPALVGNQALLDAIASAVAKHESKDLANG